jgi:MFS family permease
LEALPGKQEAIDEIVVAVEITHGIPLINDSSLEALLPLIGLGGRMKQRSTCDLLTHETLSRINSEGSNLLKPALLRMVKRLSEVKLFGMELEKGRWVLVLAGSIINIALGAIYAYSIIQIPIRRLFETVYGLKPTATEMQLPFIVFLLLSAPTMPLMGKYIEKYGPRKIAILGGVAVGMGWFAASFATSPLSLVFLYGIIGGIGSAMTYNCPIVTSGRWFPDKRGLAVGLTVLGFGFSAAITGPLMDFLMAAYGVENSLRMLGALYAAIIIVCALALRFPPAGWTPKGWRPLESATKTPAVDFMRNEMVKTRTFYGLWTCYTIGTLAGLLAIGVSKPVGLEVANSIGISEEEISAVLTALVIPFACCNGFGRPLFGWIVDKLKPMRAALISFALIFSASIAMYLYPASLVVYTIVFAILWLNLGGWLAIAPASTAAFFGVKDYARNYGLVFTAFGAGAVMGNLLVGQAKDIFGTYIAAFPYVAALALLGLSVALVTFKPPKKA